MHTYKYECTRQAITACKVETERARISNIHTQTHTHKHTHTNVYTYV